MVILHICFISLYLTSRYLTSPFALYLANKAIMVGFTIFFEDRAVVFEVTIHVIAVNELKKRCFYQIALLHTVY